MERLVRIPRELLHVALDDLAPALRAALLPVLADLPLVPDSQQSAQLIGPAHATVPCLAVLARHVGQGLRDHNLSLAHDRARLAAERRKLAFLDTATLARLVQQGDQRPLQETVLFTHVAAEGAGGEDGLGVEAVRELLVARQQAGRASFVALPASPPWLGHWRTVALTSGRP